MDPSHAATLGEPGDDLARLVRAALVAAPASPEEVGATGRAVFRWRSGHAAPTARRDGRVSRRR